ncbi:hypothetical protein [Streptomyces sp. NPDC002265]|uniref:hypothetical protein n=1 Tax=Streptomyces sp. NPDC002265 TaxID=3154415 RepID=UPI00332E64CF
MPPAPGRSLAGSPAHAHESVSIRRLRLAESDGGARPEKAAEEVEALVVTGTVHEVTGRHIFSVRQATAPRTEHRKRAAHHATLDGAHHRSPLVVAAAAPCGWTGFARYQVAPLTGRTTFAEALQIAASEPVGPATQLKPKYVQYEDFRPARREHAPDAAP